MEENNISIIKKVWHKFPRWVRTLFGFFGIIFLGALGTPAWEYLLKPLIELSVNTFFNCTFFISKTFETIIYKDIATKSIIGDTTYIKFIVMSALFVFGLFSLISARMVFLKSNYSKTEKSLATADTDRIKDLITTSENKIKALKKIMLPLAIFLFFNLFIYLIQMTENLYVAQKHSDFNYKLTICEPYLKTYEVSLLKSKFALVRSKADYNKLILQLDNTLKEHNIAYN